jgi:hypothetical protein
VRFLLPEELSYSAVHRQFTYGEFESDSHNPSWLLVAEMTAYDYDQAFINKRADDQPMTERKALPEGYFDVLERLLSPRGVEPLSPP